MKTRPARVFCDSGKWRTTKEVNSLNLESGDFLNIHPKQAVQKTSKEEIIERLFGSS